MGLVRGFLRFWWDFVIGEDWRIAAGVFVVLAVGALLVWLTDLSDGALTVVLGCALVLGVAAGIVIPGLRRRRTVGQA